MITGFIADYFSLDRPPRQAYKVEAFVENLENHDDIFSDHFSMPDPGAYSLLSVLPPRTCGLRMELAF